MAYFDLPLAFIARGKCPTSQPQGLSPIPKIPSIGREKKPLFIAVIIRYHFEMKILFIIIFHLFFVSCSHHYRYDKMCAYEVSQNHLDVPGKEEFFLDHKDETYYFSSAENRDKFRAKMDDYIKRANDNWRIGPPSSRKIQ